MFEEPTLSSDSHAGPRKRPPTLHHTPRAQGRAAIPNQLRGTSVPAAPPRPDGLDRFNRAAAGAAETALLACCASRRWALRLAAHRPYPDVESLLAAADEASYDLSAADLAEALADELSPGLHESAPQSAHTALRAAHAAYESSFGHAFVICLDGFHPAEHLDQVLSGIRLRMNNDPDEERSIAADELRRLARARLAHLVASHPEPDAPSAAHRVL
ncbi:2-oxo-4-hydroxy-4-carboxy-5-ureidoimidazoline decarboxylase [Streptomyces xanthochromogenes]|uniref:2-oxo-4-hydroxy-4-carboxy-5-ureidoimidazoline decarboxylase n=1 Tax=Streptomyces xanthochromogenes TaxID=67384 RepID=A0ABQ3A4Y1_9ACTN|nr:2-oxo-4-hydroxy-4-carboxy-5-ureidoimidazoline decarboxylase [Streptomyces xanthochromogenes]GHB21368.1 2-oxo-4-hydroxy-4-carboxy-5-ureidoimidazoline decarboxylase [Streptomyces xanthochromogenes]